MNDVARREGTAPTKAAAKCAAFKALVALDREGVIALAEPQPASRSLDLASVVEGPAGLIAKHAVPRLLPWRTEAEH